LIQSARHYRAVKARACRSGNSEAAANADLGLRAARIAKAIEVGCQGPPFPPEVVAELRNLLPPVGGGDRA
jgi:hypothetical protein